MSAAGYSLIGSSLLLPVRVKSLYPQLLLARLLFGAGTAAVTTMVTAILPAMMSPRNRSVDPGVTHDGLAESSSNPSQPDHTSNSITPASFWDSNGSGNSHNILAEPPSADPWMETPPHTSRGSHVNSISGHSTSSSSQLSSSHEQVDEAYSGASSPAGLVGTLTASGAVLAVCVLLPLPAWLAKLGHSPENAIKRSYDIAAGLAFILSIVTFIGLRHLPNRVELEVDSRPTSIISSKHSSKNPLHLLYTSATLPFHQENVGLAYFGGFIARATSVAVTLFIPLYVSQYYRREGLCQSGPSIMGMQLQTTAGNVEDAQKCPNAYTAASILTGTSQLIALLSAPLFGYISRNSASTITATSSMEGGPAPQQKNARPNTTVISLMGASFSGIIGCVLLSTISEPRLDRNVLLFMAVALIGIGQMGAIVCSLAILTDEILKLKADDEDEGNLFEADDGVYNTVDWQWDQEEGFQTEHETSGRPGADENSSLLHNDDTFTKKFKTSATLLTIKGSVAGMYSLYGAMGVLVLTKMGGALYDTVSARGPFLLLAGANVKLLILAISIIAVQVRRARKRVIRYN